VATYETSLYDEWGVRRKDFGLASLFGVSFTGRVDEKIMNSYLTLEKDSGTGQFHPLLHGLEDATRIINGSARVEVEPHAQFRSASSPLSVVPTYPDLPMESVFPRPTKNKEAGVYLRQPGAGRVVYFPWDIDRIFWQVLDVDHSTLLRNAVQWATGEPQPLSVEGKGMLDVAVWTQKDSMTVHLVNLTNPMMMKGPVREIIPLSKQKVRVQVPAGRRVSKAQLLVAKTEIPLQESNGFLQLEVPTIDLHEVVAFDFAT
jgi:hypothetical protein